jgi:LCP family protein required for cell wall assembly
LWRRVDRFDVALPGSPPGGQTYLLIGSDSRAFATSERDRARYGSASAVHGARADIVLLVRTGDAGTRVLELPRDLHVLSQVGISDLASTYIAGPQGTVDSLCHTLGVGVDHVAMLEFSGLRSIVDAVGGITITADAPTRDRVTGLTIPRAGESRLDGEQALAYVRARNLETETPRGWVPVPSPTIDRTTRARTVLEQIGGRLQVRASRPSSTQSQLWALASAIRVDNAMGMRDMLNMQHALARLRSAHRYTLASRPAAGAATVGLLGPNDIAALKAFQGPASSRKCSIPGARSSP